MAVSDSEYRAWLATEDKDPVVLVEVGYYDPVAAAAKTAYWSDAGYIDPFDVDAPNYLPLILSEIVIKESLQSSVPDDIEIFVEDQAMHDWRIVGYDVKIFYGDRSWPRADFVQEAATKTDNVSSKSASMLQLSFSDLGDYYFDQLVNGNGLGLAAGLPFVFGRVFNVEPLRFASDKFVFYTPATISDVETARDNGVPVTITNSHFIADGTGDGLRIEITLAVAPAGRVTFDIRYGTRQYGFDTSDMEFLLGQMNSYIQIPIPLGSTVASVPAYDIGYIFYQYGTVKEMLTQMCDSMGLNPRINKTGALDLIRIDDAGTPTRVARDANLLGNNDAGIRLELIATEPPYKQLELGYRKNWTVQGTDTLAGSVSAANQILYSREYTYVKNTRTLTGYPLVKNQKFDTLLALEADASAEATRRWELRDVERRIYKISDGDGTFLADDIGDTITLVSSDYGFDAGTNAVVIANSKNLTRQRCQVEVWV